MGAFANRCKAALANAGSGISKSICPLAIGVVMGLAQLLPGQAGELGVGWVSGSEKVGYRKRFQDLLLAVPTRDLEAGWGLAQQLGRPVTPLLWEMLRDEKSNVDRRLVLLCAAVLAGGPGEDERLFEWLAQQKPMLEERVMAGLLLAMGPRRTRPMASFWSRLSGPTRSPEQLLSIAVRLAAARFPDSGLEAPSTAGNDAGVLASAAFAGHSLSGPQLARMARWEDRHCDLFWRAAMLGEAWRMSELGQQPILLERAAALRNQREPPSAELLAAAILLQARAGALDAKQPRPDFVLLRVAAAETASRDLLRQWLTPVPLARDEAPQRLAVCFALMMPVDEVIAARGSWAGEPRIRSQVALALAMRLCAGAPSGLQLPASLPEVPEWPFCVWAAGGTFVAEAPITDPHLSALAELITAGRCQRTAAHDAIEDHLWRTGCHPGLGVFTQERLLIRDLMLAGSKWGGGRYQPHVRPEQRYFATGLDRSNEFFTTAVTLFEFMMRPVAPIPAEHRWR